MYAPYNEETASIKDRIAWTLCQIIDDDAPLRWTRYRIAAGCIAGDKKLMADLQELSSNAKGQRGAEGASAAPTG